jgi:hypothetical protein
VGTEGLEKSGEDNDEKRKNVKKVKKIKKKKVKKEGALRTFHPLVHSTQLGEVVLPNVSLKQLQLHQRSRSTRVARAGAVLSEAGALPNRPVKAKPRDLSI